MDGWIWSSSIRIIVYTFAVYYFDAMGKWNGGRQLVFMIIDFTLLLFFTIFMLGFSYGRLWITFRGWVQQFSLQQFTLFVYFCGFNGDEFLLWKNVFGKLVLGRLFWNFRALGFTVSHFAKVEIKSTRIVFLLFLKYIQ